MEQLQSQKPKNKAVEVVSVIIVLGLVFANLHEYLWTAMITVIGLVIGVFEVISLKATDKTISERFFESSTATKAVGASAIGAFIIYLILHLCLGI